MQALLLIVTAAAAPAQAENETIIVTASREPVAQDRAAVSTTVIGRDRIEALGFPLTADMIRLVPGASISTAGPAGSQTQLRLRGAEANHSLLFLDGIRFNDPAAGNEPRLELLTNDLLSRIEVVRGPQSALWGSEALGGVVAVESANPFAETGLSALGEYGSHDTIRASGRFAARTGIFGFSGAAGRLESDGIDSLGAKGEKDGFHNSSVNLKAMVRPSGRTELGAVAYWIDGKSRFDGYDPATFLRADTLDATKNRIWAGRAWARTSSGGDMPWSFAGDVSLLDSGNRNMLDDRLLNRTSGRRLTIGGQASKPLLIQGMRHDLVAAIEHEQEDFSARDRHYSGATDQDRSRRLTAVVGEWRAEWSPAIATDLALRHDSFSDFADATTFRASLLVRPAPRWSLHLAYGKGVARPSFYDMFGFFPGMFAGNPSLRPETSKGWEVGAAYADATMRLAITGFANRLSDEIVDILAPLTFLSSTANATGKSRRRGVEIEAMRQLGSRSTLSFNYSFLDADQQTIAGNAHVREARRARHSANLVAATDIGPLRVAGSLAYVGKRRDTDFDVFPARPVTLDAYLLAGMSFNWRVSDPLEAYVRVENGFDADYQDAVGYHTAGRTFHAGLRVRLGD